MISLQSNQIFKPGNLRGISFIQHPSFRPSVGCRYTPHSCVCVCVCQWKKGNKLFCQLKALGSSQLELCRRCFTMTGLTIGTAGRTLSLINHLNRTHCQADSLGGYRNMWRRKGPRFEEWSRTFQSTLLKCFLNFFHIRPVIDWIYLNIIPSNSQPFRQQQVIAELRPPVLWYIVVFLKCFLMWLLCTFD